jgi:hypothetical protein
VRLVRDDRLQRTVAAKIQVRVGIVRVMAAEAIVFEEGLDDGGEALVEVLVSCVFRSRKSANGGTE